MLPQLGNIRNIAAIVQKKTILTTWGNHKGALLAREVQQEEASKRFPLEKIHTIQNVFSCHWPPTASLCE